MPPQPPKMHPRIPSPPHTSAVWQLQAVPRTPEASTPTSGAGGAAAREGNSSGWGSGGSGAARLGLEGTAPPREQRGSTPGLRSVPVLSPTPVPFSPGGPRAPPGHNPAPTGGPKESAERGGAT